MLCQNMHTSLLQNYFDDESDVWRLGEQHPIVFGTILKCAAIYNVTLREISIRKYTISIL